MPLAFIVLIGVFGIGGTLFGLLMLVLPLRYPKLYDGFLSQRVMRRQQTERDRTLAIRAQGLIALATGAFFLFFVWALH